VQSYGAAQPHLQCHSIGHGTRSVPYWSTGVQVMPNRSSDWRLVMCKTTTKNSIESRVNDSANSQKEQHISFLQTQLMYTKAASVIPSLPSCA
jgi:hypothetical protein